MLTIDGNNNIILTRGDTLTLTATPKVKATGEPYEPQTGDTFRFAISKGYEGEVGYELMCEAAIPSDTWTFTIPASETKKLDYRTYNYDAEATFADGTVDTYLSAKITITGESK
jgi:hypothetical protein